LFLGLYWYARNWVILGNPFGTIAFQILGWEIWPGAISRADLARTTLATLFDPGRVEDWQVLWGVIYRWLGIPFGVLVVLAVLGIWRADRRPFLSRRRLALVIILTLITAITYWTTPYSGDNGEHGWRVTPWIEVGLRYGFPCLALLGVLGALGLNSLAVPGWVVLVVPVTTSLMGLLVQIAPGEWPLRFAVLVALIFCLPLVRERLWRPWLTMGVGLVALIIFLGFTFLARDSREYQRGRVFGRYFFALEEWTGPSETVGIVNVQRIYPAAGRAWKRRLVPTLPQTENENVWIEDLRAQAISVLLVGHATPGAEYAAAVKRVQEWVRREGGPFELIQDFQSQKRHVAVFRLR
jgi:hypothetical protein